jgi:hypothetical protein
MGDWDGTVIILIKLCPELFKVSGCGSVEFSVCCLLVFAFYWIRALQPEPV